MVKILRLTYLHTYEQTGDACILRSMDEASPIIVFLETARNGGFVTWDVANACTWILHPSFLHGSTWLCGHNMAKLSILIPKVKESQPRWRHVLLDSTFSMKLKQSIFLEHFSNFYNIRAHQMCVSTQAVAQFVSPIIEISRSLPSTTYLLSSIQAHIQSKL